MIRPEISQRVYIYTAAEATSVKQSEKLCC